MKRLSRCVIVGGLAVLSYGESSLGAERVLTGELVVVGAPRFRLVGHDGTFKAPPGAPIVALEGKVVDVAMETDGRVLAVTERQIAITPRVVILEKVRGQLVVLSAAERSFTLTGDTRVYGAPLGIDLAPYNGKWVETTLDADGRVTTLRLVPFSSAATSR